VTPVLSTLASDGYHDFHCSNVGIGADYKLVVFDW
jgi:hypothetical protein